MVTTGAESTTGRAPVRTARLFRLPRHLADFETRGFRLDRPDKRRRLEQHAQSFLTGFNLAGRHWRDPHRALATIATEERGFAYEGAGMYAAMRGMLARGDGAAFRRLCAGPGDDYIHLIHVGYGWAGAVVPRLRRTVPSTPLLRWLALDGAGFARVFFGGTGRLHTMRHRPPTDLSCAELAGAGRALWFVESASADGVAAVIEQAHPHARAELWSGIGLACAYAGCAEGSALDDLLHASGPHRPAFGQGALFAIAARARARRVPGHTAQVCSRIYGVTPQEAAEWTDIAAHGLTDSGDITAYTEWKSRLRRTVAARL